MDGIINLLKPAGMTSHDAVAFVRRVTGVKKVGHNGTLDPLAAGVLPIFVGKATRLIEYMPNEPKTYIAEWLIGIDTDTEDTSGTVQQVLPSTALTLDDWEQAAEKFVGIVRQLPSAYSAIKINGKKAYELARRNQKIDLPLREVQIFSISDISWHSPYLAATVTCSSGTYIRALGRDWAQSIGTAAAMSFLLRCRVGRYWTTENALTLEEIMDNPQAACYPVEHALVHLPRVDLTPSEGFDFCCGKRISAPPTSSPAAVWERNRFLGIARYNEKTKEWQPHKVWIN